jgi:predicted alpha/beta hydrolase
MRIEVEAADGHRFAVHWHPACARGGPALLFLPALAVPADRYERFAQALNTQGVSVAVPDWRGLASSSLRASRRVDWGYRELLELDLPAVRSALDAHAPVQPAWSIGGHSLGGQLAALAAALAPGAYAGLVLVATGVSDARLFPRSDRWGVRLFARALPLLTRLFGYFPGRMLRWAGREAGTLMRQWAGTVLSGSYRGVGIARAEERLSALHVPVLGIRFTEDWLASDASLRGLVDKVGVGPRTFEAIDGARLGDRADHFRWLKTPAVPAAIVAGWLRNPGAGVSP